MTRDFRSDFLFATPSFIEGMGRLMDFANALTEYNTSRSTEEADRRATTQDWMAVGDEIRGALATYPSHVGR